MTEAAQSFSILLDRSPPSDVRLASWCPTMDLLALVTQDGQLHLHRLNWQRLWWTAPEAQITTLAWRPDGKQIAIGTDDGTLMLLSTEDGEIQHQQQIFTPPTPEDEQLASITALCWVADTSPPPKIVDGVRPPTPLQNRVQRMFQPPSTEPLPSPLAQGMGYSKLSTSSQGSGGQPSRSWPIGSQRLTVLSAVSAGGELHICAAGLFPLAHIHLSPVLVPSPPNNTSKYGVANTFSVHRLSMDGSLQELALLYKQTNGKLQIATLSTTQLQEHASRLHWLASCASEITETLTGAETVLKEAAKEWSSGRTVFVKAFEALDKLLQEHGIESNAQGDLTLLVTMGEYSAAMEQLLSSAMGENGLRQTARAMDAAVCSVHNLFVERLQPAMERLAFRLGELRGFIGAGYKESTLGLSVLDIGNAERLLLQFITQLESFRVHLTHVGCQYRTFFSWLLTALRRLPDDTVDTLMGYPLSHVDTVQDFLLLEFSYDSIQEWFGNPPIHSAFELAGNVTLQHQQQRRELEQQEYTPSIEITAANKAANDKLTTTTTITTNNNNNSNNSSTVTAAAADDAAQLAFILESLSGCLENMGTLDNTTYQKLEVKPKIATRQRLHLIQQLEHISEILTSELLLQTTQAISPSIKVAYRTVLGSASSVLALTHSLIPSTGNNGEEEQEQEAEVQTSTDNTTTTTTAIATTTTSISKERMMAVVAWDIPKPLTNQSEPSIVCLTHQNGVLRAARTTINNTSSTSTANCQVIDAAFYKNDSVMLLHTIPQPEGCRLTLLPQSCLQYVDVGAGQTAVEALTQAILEGQQQQQPVVDLLAAVENNSGDDGVELLRHRDLMYPQTEAPLAVSATRGVGCVLIGKQRLLLLDLEEDEDEELGEDEDEEMQEN